MPNGTTTSENDWTVFPKLNIVLSYNPVIVFLGIYPTDLKITSMLSEKFGPYHLTWLFNSHRKQLCQLEDRVGWNHFCLWFYNVRSFPRLFGPEPFLSTHSYISNTSRVFFRIWRPTLRFPNAFLNLQMVQFNFCAVKLYGIWPLCHSLYSLLQYYTE